MNKSFEYLFISPYLEGIGGMETVINSVLSYFSENEYSYKLLQMGGTSNKQWLDGLEVIETKEHKNVVLRNISYLVSMFKYINMFQPKVIICLDPILCRYVSIICRMIPNGKSITCISWIHFSLFKSSVRYKSVLRLKYHFAISTGQLEEFNQLGVDKDNIRLIYNPVEEVSSLIEQTQRHELKRFIYVGRIILDGQKNLRGIIDALNDLEGHWRLDVYGTGADLEESIEYVRLLGHHERVKFHGYVINPFNKIDYPVTALILNSNYEGFGMVLSEAISYGVFVISRDCPVGPQDLVKTGVNGILIDMEKNSLKEALIDVMNGYSLPNPIEIKKSIKHLSGKRYFNNFIDSINYFVDKNSK